MWGDHITIMPVDLPLSSKCKLLYLYWCLAVLGYPLQPTVQENIHIQCLPNKPALQFENRKPSKHYTSKPIILKSMDTKSQTQQSTC